MAFDSRVFCGEKALEASTSSANFRAHIERYKSAASYYGRHVTHWKLEDIISLAGTSLSASRSTAYTVNELSHNLSPRNQVRFEAAKFIGVISILFTIKSLLKRKDVEEEEKKEKLLDVGINCMASIAAFVDNVVMVGEATIAVFKTSARVTRVVSQLGVVSGFLGLIPLIIDTKAIIEAHNGIKAIDSFSSIEVEAGYKAAFKNRLHKIEVSRGLNILVTLVSFAAFWALTFCAASAAVVGWGLLATAMTVVLATKAFEWHADHVLFKDIKNVVPAAA